MLTEAQNKEKVWNLWESDVFFNIFRWAELHIVLFPLFWVAGRHREFCTRQCTQSWTSESWPGASVIHHCACVHDSENTEEKSIQGRIFACYHKPTLFFLFFSFFFYNVEKSFIKILKTETVCLKKSITVVGGLCKSCMCCYKATANGRAGTIF